MKSGWKSRFFKIAIVIVLCIAGVVAYLRFFAGHVQETAESPEQNLVAEVRLYNFGFATDAPDTAVQLRTRLNPLRHTIFFALNYGGSVTVSWLDSHTLMVRCQNAKNLSIYKKLPAWNDVSIRYIDIDGNPPHTSPN